MTTTDYDAILLVSFGGPEQEADVIPFMERVTAGRGIPRERLEEVSQHYFQFGGRSPINDQNRALKAALETLIATEGPDLPVYWGNRNWHPLLADTLREMRDDGVRRALCFVTSAYSSYSGCRQYRENLAAARAEVGDGAPELDKIRVYYNHPGFVEPQVSIIRDALGQLPEDVRDDAALVFTTHSIPTTMSRHSDYEVQHYETCRLVAEAFPGRPWQLVYNSRSGPAFVPWLEPDVNDHLEQLAGQGTRAVVVVPIGFISDHMEVIYDLDVEAAATAGRLGLAFARAATVGTDDRFVRGIRDLVLERVAGGPVAALGTRGPNWDVCPVDCCFTPGQEARPTVAQAASRPRPGADRPGA
ncbi:ferrochelatase [Egicoccus halophilus]|uniref:Coproporphyrin III ferrochelatase n=1 Tax=Egicoccus halophilus TaxID=1670830 RepID=A0A8J3ADK8_9ACTN|nr:ferrochelatase [Egicoccus halophilus]GGI09605.1 putative ferrochelatase [Egicoccus halophilus]